MDSSFDPIDPFPADRESFDFLLQGIETRDFLDTRIRDPSTKLTD